MDDIRRLEPFLLILALLTLTFSLVETNPAVSVQVNTGDILIIDLESGTNNQGTLFQVDPATGMRNILSDFGNTAQGPLGLDPSGMTVEVTGTILVTDQNAGTGGQGALFRVAPVTGVRTLLSDFGNTAQGPLGQDPLGVTVEVAGTILVVDITARALFRVDPTSGVRTLLSDFNNTIQGPQGGTPADLAIETANNILVIDWSAGTNGRGALFRVNPATGVRTLLSDLGDAAQGPLGDNPAGVAVEATGDILVTDFDGGASHSFGVLFRVDPVTGVRTLLSDFGFSTQGPPGVNPWYMGVEASGAILVQDGCILVPTPTGCQGKLFRVDPATGTRTILSDFGNAIQGPLGLNPLGMSIFTGPPVTTSPVTTSPVTTSPVTTSPSSGSVVSFFGETADDWSGHAVAGVGDIDNNGYDDFLISAILNDAGGEQAGKIYLFAGGSGTNWVNSSLSSATGSFIGESIGNEAGTVVSGVGDVNNDGFDDFVITAPHNREGGSFDVGQTYLILGRANAASFQNFNLSQADASFIGETEFDQAGAAVAGVGDVNNDGFDDFIIAAPFNDEGGEEAGQTYLILGRQTSMWNSDTSLAQADASFIGEANHTGSGHAVAGVGDVNSDGFDDFLISAPWGLGAVTPEIAAAPIGAAPPGKTYLIFGRATSMWQMDTNLSQASASFIGEVADDQFGFSVAGAGDVNNDMVSDFLIGANWNDEGGNQAGQTYLFLGGSNFASDMSASQANASFIGEANDDMSGWAVARAGNMNGDDFDDFLISAPGNIEGGLRAGKTYLIYGRPGAQWSLDIDLSQAGWSFVGEAMDDWSGHAVAGAGDVNNDSFSDILIGAFGNDEQATDAGKTYLFFEALPPNCVRRGSTVICVTTSAFNITTTTPPPTTTPPTTLPGTTGNPSTPVGFIPGFDVVSVLVALFSAAAVLPRALRKRKNVDESRINEP